jgi:hypothetical protein
MTERNPDEVAGMQGSIAEFYRSIEQAGVDGEMAIDALEFAIWNLLVDSIDSRESLDQYLDEMRERCLRRMGAHNGQDIRQLTRGLTAQ